MLTKEEKTYYKEIAKQERLFCKLRLILMVFPFGSLLYTIYNFDGKEGQVEYSDLRSLLINLAFIAFFFVVIYVTCMFSKIKADIYEEIATKPGLE